MEFRSPFLYKVLGGTLHICPGARSPELTARKHRAEQKERFSFPQIESAATQYELGTSLPQSAVRT